MPQISEQSLFLFTCKKDGKGAKSYHKLGNPHLTLRHTDTPGYRTPWTMWLYNSNKSESHIGNIKIGPANITCPEHSKVCYLVPWQ